MAIRNLQRWEQEEMKPRNLAAIDIGSNAIRLVLALKSKDRIQILKKYRVALRLGQDVFQTGVISAATSQHLSETFREFQKILEQHKIQKERAVATSALREAQNQKQILRQIHKDSGIHVELINGIEEARLVFLAVKKRIHLERHHALLMDIGGGSVEISVSHQAHLVATKSFPYGTVRTLQRLQKQSPKNYYKEFQNQVEDFLKVHPHRFDFLVGTGGNLDTFARLKKMLLKNKNPAHISIQELRLLQKKLDLMSYDERISKLKLRPDRADVIVPAIHLTLTLMKAFQIQSLLLPQVGLKEGILLTL